MAINIFRWFKPQQPEPRALTSALRELFGMNDSGAGEWGFQQAVSQGFKTNPIVYAALREIADAASAVDLTLERKGEELDPDHLPKPLANLQSLLTRPNTYQSGSEFVKKWVQHIYLAGISFIHFPGTELWLIPPDSVEMRPHIGALGKEEVIYRVQGRGGMRDVEPDLMRHIAFPDPTSTYGGFSPVSVARLVIKAHNSAVKWNKNLLDNEGKLSILVFLKNVIPNLKEFLRAEKKYQAELGGAENAGKVKLIPGDVAEIKEVGLNAKDLDWLEGKRDMMRDVCAVLGVPSQLLGDQANSTYSNYQEARKAFYHETVLPLMNHFVQELNAWLVPKFDASAKIVINTEHIDALRADENEKVQRLNTAWWMTINERRAEMGLEPVSGGDVVLVSFNEVPVGSVPSQPQTKSGFPFRTYAKPLEHINSKSLYRTEEQRVAAYRRNDRKRKLWETQFAAKMRDYWREQERKAVSALGELEPREMRADLPIDFLRGENERFAKEFAPLYSGVVVEFGQDAIDELGAKGVLFDIDNPDVRQFLTDTLTERSRLINETTAKKIRGVLEEGVQQGEGIAKLKERLRDLYGSWGEDLAHGRAQAIARTEVGRASGYAKLEGYKQQGVRLKEWVTARDNDVRDEHQALDGEVVAATEPFSNGAMFAPDGINCRCVLAPLMDESEKV